MVEEIEEEEVESFNIEIAMVVTEEGEEGTSMAAAAAGRRVGVAAKADTEAANKIGEGVAVVGVTGTGSTMVPGGTIAVGHGVPANMAAALGVAWGGAGGGGD